MTYYMKGINYHLLYERYKLSYHFMISYDIIIITSKLTISYMTFLGMGVGKHLLLAIFFPIVLRTKPYEICQLHCS